MAMKNKGRKVYRTMQGKQIDLDLLIKRNEMTPAVGNARVNARGDELGPGGKIIRKHEEVVREYYNSRPVVDEPTKKREVNKTELSSAEAKSLAEFDEEPVPPKKTTRTATKTAESKWVEDEDGNFIQKGE
jgi:hypothetical protein